MYLIHFRSTDFSTLHRQGRFWHLFLPSGGIIISQNEADIWTLHTPIPLDTDVSQLDPVETIQKAITGSFGGKIPLKIDEIFVRSTWRPNIYLAEHYTIPGGRVFLAGDSIHQNIPTGGYGMNSAVGDSFDIGWKIAAVLNGYAGPALLASYEAERRPVAARNLEQSGKHWKLHETYSTLVREASCPIHSKTEEGFKLRQKIKDLVEANPGENTSFGLELDYRYTDSPVIISEEDGEAPPWDQFHYTPSTWPGVRVPSVWLKDGTTNIFDLLGRGSEFTIVDFTASGHYKEHFAEMAFELRIPLKVLHLPNEEYVRRLWERDAVLVRPDDHVAWRAQREASENISLAETRKILKKVTGQRHEAVSTSKAHTTSTEKLQFTGTTGNVDQDSVEMRGGFQFQ